MPYGNELFLGFSGNDILPAAEALGLTIDWEGNPPLGPSELVADIDKRLDGAYVKCLGMFDFFTDIQSQDGHYHVQTPLGRRDMVPWKLELAYDPYECGDETADAVLGVSLISRYFPTYLDWKDPHGGSGATLYLDATNMQMIDRARGWIVHAMPNATALQVFSTARICVKNIFY